MLIKLHITNTTAPCLSSALESISFINILKNNNIDSSDNTLDNLAKITNLMLHYQFTTYNQLEQAIQIHINNNNFFNSFNKQPQDKKDPAINKPFNIKDLDSDITLFNIKHYSLDQLEQKINKVLPSYYNSETASEFKMEKYDFIIKSDDFNQKAIKEELATLLVKNSDLLKEQANTEAKFIINDLFKNQMNFLHEQNYQATAKKAYCQYSGGEYSSFKHTLVEWTPLLITVFSAMGVGSAYLGLDDGALKAGAKLIGTVILDYYLYNNYQDYKKCLAETQLSFDDFSDQTLALYS
jgi:hypothetical protein